MDTQSKARKKPQINSDLNDIPVPDGEPTPEPRGDFDELIRNGAAGTLGQPDTYPWVPPLTVAEAAANATRRTVAERNGAPAPPYGQDHPVEVRTTCAAAIRPKPLRWLVPEMFPLGKLTLLAGDGGLGKSVITIDLAARLSRGECAFGLEYPAIAGETLIAGLEDEPADTVVPRLLAAGADLTRIHFLDGVGSEEKGRPAPWSLAHYAALNAYLSAHRNIRFFVIDPASAFAGLAGTDGHKDAELRALLGPLAEVASRHAVTGLLVAHLGKNETARAVRRVMGSVAWVNAVRAAWIVAEREEDGGKRLPLPIKNCTWSEDITTHSV